MKRPNADLPTAPRSGRAPQVAEIAARNQTSFRVVLDAISSHHTSAVKAGARGKMVLLLFFPDGQDNCGGVPQALKGLRDSMVAAGAVWQVRGTSAGCPHLVVAPALQRWTLGLLALARICPAHAAFGGSLRRYGRKAR